jgi:hypothetical protein
MRKRGKLSSHNRNRFKTIICCNTFLSHFVWRNLLSYTKVTDRSSTDGRDDTAKGIHLSACRIRLQLPLSCINQPKAFIASKGSLYWHWCVRITAEYWEVYWELQILCNHNCSMQMSSVFWHMELFTVVLVMLKKEKKYFPVLLNVLSLVHINMLAVQTANSYWVTSRTIGTTNFKFWGTAKISFFCFSRLVWNVGN